MKTLNLVAAGVIDTDGDDDDSTAVDLSTQDHPFSPGNDVVGVLQLKNVVGDTAGFNVTVLGTDDGTTYAALYTLAVGAAAVEDDGVYFFNVKLPYKIKVRTHGTTAAAGSYRLDVISN